MDIVETRLHHLEPLKFGLDPMNPETYIAIAVKHYFLFMKQEKRLTVLRNLIEPKALKFTINGNSVSFELSAAAMDRSVLAMLAKYSTQMVLQRICQDAVQIITSPKTPDVDIPMAVGYDMMAVKLIQNIYDSFDPKKMSPELESFLRGVFEAVVN